ncbi:hypothetical protein RKE25_23210 (plasmid) [Dyella sp. BiH032]|uniref:hypothetical protein n=1 Tax=Dyella sp. BiH032 TaxID=3075430 RepID=UPI002892B6BF|nr:hypothetical protein [Dyella sp. BiH032]WNL48525.1 hypothetical protein RKE25_23210 [Dyella sp. BiH032]
MVNHPNRSRKKKADDDAATPDPAAIKAARIDADLSQTAAAALVYSPLITWQKWEQGQANGGNRMHPAFFKLFKLKVRPDYVAPVDLPKPAPATILAKRESLGLTRKEAAALLMVTESGWQRWETEGTGGRPMHLAFWELLHVLTRDKT